MRDGGYEQPICATEILGSACINVLLSQYYTTLHKTMEENLEGTVEVGAKSCMIKKTSHYQVGLKQELLSRGGPMGMTRTKSIERQQLAICKLIFSCAEE